MFLDLNLRQHVLSVLHVQNTATTVVKNREGYTSVNWSWAAGSKRPLRHWVTVITEKLNFHHIKRRTWAVKHGFIFSISELGKKSHSSLKNTIIIDFETIITFFVQLISKK